MRKKFLHKIVSLLQKCIASDLFVTIFYNRVNADGSFLPAYKSTINNLKKEVNAVESEDDNIEIGQVIIRGAGGVLTH